MPQQLACEFVYRIQIIISHTCDPNTPAQLVVVVVTVLVGRTQLDMIPYLWRVHASTTGASWKMGKPISAKDREMHAYAANKTYR